MLTEPAVLPAAPRQPAPSATPRPVLGGEAWVVPHEPGGHPWITATAPQVRLTDRRGR